MRGYVSGTDWLNAEPMKYWSYPSGYDQKSKKSKIREMILSGDYIGSLKVDGFYQRVIKDEDDEIFMVSRSKGVTGLPTNKVDWVPHLHGWMNSLPNGTVLICECYLPQHESSKNVTAILGCDLPKALERQESEKLHLYVFDVAALCGAKLADEQYQVRTATVDCLAKHFTSPFVEYATFYRGEQLLDQLDRYLSEGREGMVITRCDAPMCEGRTSARVSVKIKRELQQTVDCVIIGTNPPEVNYTGDHLESWQYFCSTNMRRLPEGYHPRPAIPVTRSFYKRLAGSLQLGLYDKDGNLVHFGDLSGLSDENLTEESIGKVCEVSGMEIDSVSGHIRHPRFVQWRTDKAPEECTLDQVKA